MRFSVLTVTFNAEKYLAETLESTAMQTFSDFEHLLWDGGSTDKTLEIARRYPHVKIFQGKDKGIADAMNKIAENATGDFLVHLHADDRFAHPRVLEQVDVCLKQHPTIEWLFGLVETIDSQGIKQKIASFVPYEAKRLKKYNCIAHPATFISTKVFRQFNGFDISLRYCMDYDLWLRLSSHVQGFAFPAMIACFREHEHSLSTREKKAVTDEAYYVRNCYITSPYLRWKSKRTWKRRMKECTGC